MTRITSEEFEILKKGRGVQCETEKDGEWLYETLTNEDGEEIAFASYRDGRATYAHFMAAVAKDDGATWDRRL